MDYTNNYIAVLQGRMDIPELKTRQDIWKYFPVAAKPMSAGKDKLEWHISNMIKMSKATKIKIDAMKPVLEPKLLAALKASDAWSVEEGTNATTLAVLRMKSPKHNKTRKNYKNTAPPVVEYRKWNATHKNTGASVAAVSAQPAPAPASVNRTNKNKKPNANNGTRKAKKPKTQAEMNENAFFERLAAKTNEEKAANNLLRRERMKKYIKEQPEHIKQIKQIVNKLTAENQEKLTQDLVSIIPTSPAEFKESMDTFVDLALNTQAYHPLFIHAVHALNAKKEFPFLASDALSESYMSKFQTAFSNPTFLTPKTQQELLNYRCYLLFAGYMYREEFLSWPNFQKVLQRLEELSMDEDNPNIQSEAILGLTYALIRSGKRMIMEGDDSETEFGRYLEYLTDLSKYYAVQRIRFQIQDFLDSVKADFKIRAADPWAVGAPNSNLKAKGKAKAVPEPPQKAKGLGEDISELWRRYPLDVKQQGDVWVVKFHNKKLAERYEKERRRFPNQGAMQQAFQQEIQSLVENSAVWSLGPSYPGAVLTIVSKV